MIISDMLMRKEFFEGVTKEKQEALQKYILKQLEYFERTNSTVTVEKFLQLVGLVSLQSEANIPSIVDKWLKENFDKDTTKTFYSRDLSLMELLLKNDERCFTGWGAESDFKALFEINKYDLNNDSKIKVCAPLELSDSSKLLELMNEGKEESQEQRVILYIPMLRGSHWLLGQLTFEKHALVKGYLFDSLQGDSNQLEQFSNVVGEPSKISPNYKNIQNNAFSCFDYVCQEIMSNLNPEDPLVKAKDAQTLRIEILKKIASKKGIGFAFETPRKAKRSNFDLDRLNDDTEIQQLTTALLNRIYEKYPQLENGTPISIRSINERVLFTPGSEQTPDNLFSASEKKEEHFILPRNLAPTFEKNDDSIKAENEHNDNTEVKKLNASDIKEFEEVANTSSMQAVLRELIPSEEKKREIEKAENAFIENYDDSSDEENEGEELSQENVKRYFSHTKEADDNSKFAFLMDIFGRIVLRSPQVQRKYRSLKSEYLRINSLDFETFKRKFIEIVNKQYAKTQEDESKVKYFVWPSFLLHIRKLARSKKFQNISPLLLSSLKEALQESSLLPKRIHSDKELVLGEIIKEIIKLLPERHTRNVEITASTDYDKELFAMVLFEQRVARRIFKEKLEAKAKLQKKEEPIKFDEEIKLFFTMNSFGTECKNKMILDTISGKRSKNFGADYRKDHVEYFGTYTEIFEKSRKKRNENDYELTDSLSFFLELGKEELDSKNFKDASVRTFSSEEITEDMKNIMAGLPLEQEQKGKFPRHCSLKITKSVGYINKGDKRKLDKSYMAKDQFELANKYAQFLRHFYFLLHMVEVSRNPATLCINLFLFDFLANQNLGWGWEMFLPRQGANVTLEANINDQILLFPMALEGATDAAAALVEKHNESLPENLYYSYHEKGDKEGGKVIAERQYRYLNNWFYFERKKGLASLHNDEVISDILEAVRKRYGSLFKK